MIANPNTRFFRIKAAQQELIAMAGGVEKAGELTSYGKSSAGRWNNPGDPDLMPLAVVLQLEAAFGLPLVTAAMAELNGRRLSDPEELTGSNGNLLLLHAETVGKAAEMMSAGALAYSDNRLTPAEAVQIDKSLAALERTIGDYRKDLASARAAGGLKVVGGDA
ncbi:hypothetical protein [Mesorhizobium sp. M0129]|uniref:hypothetical protein n=1 Tax=Mesorhizobium sp. M0129 TaxID=2956886 RepID=UPI00333BC541